MKKNKSSSKLGKKRLPHNNGVVRSNKSCKRSNNNLVPIVIKKHKDKNGGHSHIILEDIDDKHLSIGLTSKSKKGSSSKSGKNYKLEHSPFNNGRDSYMRKQGTIDFKNQYGPSYNCFISSNDMQKAKLYSKNAKQKYLANKKK